MNWKTIGLVVLLADFVAFTAWVVAEYGYVGIFAAALTNAATMQIGVDLVVALSLACVWMRADARARNVSSTPYLVLTLLAGSIGPLLYLIVRGWRTSTEPAALRATAA
jgi:hypothetical protein